VTKRRVRRDRADVFCTLEEGVKASARSSGDFVDEVVPRSRLAEATRQRAQELAARTDRPKNARGIVLSPLERTIESARIRYRFATCEIDRARAAPRSRCRDRTLRLRATLRASTPPGSASGRSPSRASWTTSSCICAQTRKRSASGCFDHG